MLQNTHTLAFGGIDTEENGPSKVRQVTNRIRRNIGAQLRGAYRSPQSREGMAAMYAQVMRRVHQRVAWAENRGYEYQ